MDQVTLGEDEHRLRAEFFAYPEYEVADWATQSLAVVFSRASRSEWNNPPGPEPRRRAIMLLTVRLLRAIRAGMAVHAAGWEIEGRAMTRLVIEARGRLYEVVADLTADTADAWLARKPKTSIAEALERGAPELPPGQMRAVFGALSQDVHADVGGVLRALAAVDPETLAAEVMWGPRHTMNSRRVLFIYATFAGEASSLLAEQAGVEHPDETALVARVEHASIVLAEAESHDGQQREPTRG